MRILTLNVQNLEGDPRRQEILNAELRRLDPDLVSFQEIVQDPQRDQLAELLSGTQLQGTHQAQTLAYAPPFADRYGGTAVATRWPHRVVETLDLLVQGETHNPWCTLATIVEVPGQGDMLFIATTTSPRFDGESVQERQAVMLTDLDRRHRQVLPTVIAGDFTARPESASIRYLTGLQSLAGQSVLYHDAWELAGEGPGYTWTPENPATRAMLDLIIRQPGFRCRIDYVLVGSAGSGYAHPEAQAEVRSAALAFNQPVDGIWPSDHFGVLVELDVAGSRRPDRDQALAV